MSTGEKPPTTLDEAYGALLSRFRKLGLQTPELDATILIEAATGATTLERMTNGSRRLTPEMAERLEAMMERRVSGEPVHRIIGWREFYGLKLGLNASTLIPRPDTETLVDLALPFVRNTIAARGECLILDLGTGTGAVALALVSEAPGAMATGVDISSDALSVATANAEANGLSGSFNALRSDWFSQVSGRFDLIISNPPYIAGSVIPTLEREVREHDPLLALDGGADGLDAYGIIASRSPAFLRSGGMVALETGYDQRRPVTMLMESAGFRLVEARADLSGNDRALLFSM